jgi:hypothetical protein
VTFRSYLSSLVVLVACAACSAVHAAIPTTEPDADSLSVAAKLPNFPAKPADLDQARWTALQSVVAQALPTTSTELTASDGTPGNDFGWSIALSGTTAFIGAYSKTIGSNNYQGAVYVFTFNGSSWVQQQELTASDGAANDGFGYSVALSGTTALVGAYQKTIGSNFAQGAVYVFTFNGSSWVQQQELTASNGAAYSALGISVALSGNIALVGADDASTDTFISSTHPGAAYVFTFNGTTWIQQQELNASDGAVGDWFGISVALSGTTALVGAVNRNIGSNTAQGAAYVFTFNGSSWIQQQELTSSDGAADDFFGYSVALSGLTALIGAEGKTIGSNFAQGAAYVFTFNGSSWVQQQELTASNGAGFDQFGYSVALSDTTALVGAYAKTIGSNTWQGAAYVFFSNDATWVQQEELTASDGAHADYFGTSVALSGSTAMIGASGPFIGASSTYAGAVYVFSPVGDAIFCDGFDGTGLCR